MVDSIDYLESLLWPTHSQIIDSDVYVCVFMTLHVHHVDFVFALDPLSEASRDAGLTGRAVERQQVGLEQIQESTALP